MVGGRGFELKSEVLSIFQKDEITCSDAFFLLADARLGRGRLSHTKVERMV